ncbi:cyclic beta-1,2-glucan synthetase [Altererythrobacter atlanticus]|uniref:N,N'-diacetylchitobiose phosphorylase n=1 Tax=Croceibacterium atlanticum TaxID=1267766 RepID=A0A0F7KXM1_9SPHN|nr:glucoamylase family protein [Croceibacterium atlanticum]AKH43957.1 N,N'-diacetylchitobiose phosphorylase [Croceibacterium atlanticum]MBB5733593.1 cyclic beta-1,2-glucan synthetase [Croceibacterium atlanticum]
MAEADAETGGLLEQIASQLSARHILSEKPPLPIPAWARLEAGFDWLHDVRCACVEAPPEAGKAAEWLLDNDYQIHRALRQIKKDLPHSFYSRLPALASEAEPDVPRVFALAHELLHATRLQLSLGHAVRFVSAYQQGAGLTIAELWAFPTMLRIASIEILVSSITPLVCGERALPFRATAWTADPESLDSTERVARSIASLAAIASIPWEDFFDRTSRVEAILCEDPSGFYSRMDFESRDRYRRRVEELSRHCAANESDVAAEAVEQAASAQPGDVAAHVGYWLVGPGRRTFEARTGASFPRGQRLRRAVLLHPGIAYSLALIFAGIGALILPAFYLHAVGTDLSGWIAGLILSLIPASVFAITVVHWIISRSLPPRVLDKLDFSKGLAKDSRTIVIVPVIVAAPGEAARAAEQVETHWLANSDPMLQVALLADLPDAAEERMPGDVEIEAALESRIRALNERHGANGKGSFHLLLRPRSYNPSQGCWLAWERKRGKVEQFNRLLIEGDDSAFSLHVGDRAALENIRFVVTVDADTMLPQGSVAKLAGALAHPLNQPKADPETGRIISGYSIIQPRVEISPKSGMRTLFARLFTGDTAIDIYSRAVSDVYQDLFGAGIFVGKGIYDLRAFHESVDGRVPENRILSHDLFEGAHGRAALATDIVLYEGFPASYSEFGQRMHRWIRGDWQLLPWLGRSVPAADGSRLPNRLTGLDRWKIIDNLRRSLVPPSLMLLALGDWFFLPGSAWFWTLLVVFAPAGQLFTDLVSGLARGRRRSAVRSLPARLSDQAGRWLLAIVFLLYEAALSLHAIGVTLWRIFVSRRNLLQWTSAAHVAAKLRGHTTRGDVWKQMWWGPAAALCIGFFLLLVRPQAMPAALPLLLLWLAAPEIAWWIGRPRKPDVEPLADESRLFLRSLARKTWYFFETFAGPGDNWLPPDNYQAEPHEEVAHRTSPTNIGMLLVSTAVAWDLGYIGRIEFAARARNLFDSLDGLDGYRGHLFNWYDTRSLRPLEPRYVSTVDSGNLALSLIVYAQALREAGAATGLEPQRWDGLADVVNLLDAAFAVAGATAARNDLAKLADRLNRSKRQPEDWATHLEAILQTDIPPLEAHVAEIAAPPASLPAETLRELYAWIDRLQQQIRTMLRDMNEQAHPAHDFQALAAEATALAYSMDFTPLYNTERGLFHIGHNVSSGKIDPHFYDLLASEARIASLFAIGKGDVPLEHWFHLGRPVTRAGHHMALISWNGSMFEYLMPRLFLRSGPETLLYESEHTAVRIQRDYGIRHEVPWGISESAYASRDPEHRYRYQAFGVPGIGLRRGLARDMVVAPYASALALAVAPAEAAKNLAELLRLGAGGRFGLFEAADFTLERRTSEELFAPVKAYMAHHQGMILCAIDNALGEDILVHRLARDPRLNLVSLLLSERLPTELPAEIERLEELDRQVTTNGSVRPLRPWEPDTAAPFPQVLLLGNGRLSSWISDGGGGRLRWRGQAITRLAPDTTRDADGVWIYVADDETGDLWSATRQPTGAVPDEYRAVFHPHLAEFHRRDHRIELRMEAGVAAGDDIEIRRLVIANESDRPRSLRLTSYAEVVLAPPLEDERHPAFSKLFVASERIPHLGAILHYRRPRSPHETPPVMLHYALDTDGPIETARFESDRRAFIGRGNNSRNPAGATSDLGNSSGCTLDPIAALQVRLDLGPFESREVCFLSVAAATREGAIEIAERYLTPASINWAMQDAALETARAVRQLRLDPDALHRAQTLSSLMIHPSGVLRANSPASLANRLGQPSLWGMALSGDLPIMVLRATQGSGDMLEELVGAHQLWRRMGLETDLVILQGSGSAYIEPLREEIVETLRDVGAIEMLGRKGGVHLLFSDQIGTDQVRLLEAVAAVLFDETQGTLSEQMERAMEPVNPLPLMVPSMPEQDAPATAPARPADLLFDNGIGGFSADGREYVIHLEAGEKTPAPWSNILANDEFGCLATETGGGFTWAINSGENRITPWTNDPVSDRPTDALYLRDEETAAVWSVTPAPAGNDAACQIRHGAGYSTWHKHAHGLEQELLVFVPTDAPVKIVRLRVRNLLDRHRRLTATQYAEWLLGSLPSMARPHVRCDYDADAQILLAHNYWNPDFADRAAFLAASRKPHGFTTDRREFLGKEADLARPASLGRWGLTGETSGGLDPCGVYQVHLDLAPGGTDEVIFVLGQGKDQAEALTLAKQWRDPQRVEQALHQLGEYWDGVLGSIEVHTPDPAFDLMANRWLVYQSLSSRILARTGFYQASGAIGFRDQLQDMLAFLYSEPERVRAHILLCAEHQFEEGDVLHWWHPPSDRGVRTRCSDDLLWLPYAVGTYVAATGDVSILHERLRFLDAPPLAAGEEDRYSRFEHSLTRAPLIEHCERALARALKLGAHDLPLIGSGDWNDGMDRIGKAGRGESVWLAWFAAVTADAVADLDRRIGRAQEAERWAKWARELRQNAEGAGWDGAWYRRAYDDEGHAWGSAQSEECRIDSISQSWAALAGADPARVEQALGSALTELVDEEHHIARLLWPPFDQAPHDPGYIKAYPPGIRENGGQYSHAAAWLGIALARTGKTDEAMKVFNMLNPIARAMDPATAKHYRGEPYVVAGDISAGEQHGGRSGWTWYTGSAAWTWRFAVETILGLSLADGKLRIDPRIPPGWPGFQASVRRAGGILDIRVENPHGLSGGRVELVVDGHPHAEQEIEFPGDGGKAEVVARIVE